MWFRNSAFVKLRTIEAVELPARPLNFRKNPWRASALGFPDPGFWGRKALVPLRSTGAQARSGGNQRPRGRCTASKIRQPTKPPKPRKISHTNFLQSLDRAMPPCYYITDAAQRGISMRIFICSSFIYPAFQTEDKRKNGRTEETRHQNWRVNNQEVPQNVRNHCNRW